jgi:hypothetical protein
LRELRRSVDWDRVICRLLAVRGLHVIPHEGTRIASEPPTPQLFLQGQPAFAAVRRPPTPRISENAGLQQCARRNERPRPRKSPFSPSPSCNGALHFAIECGLE